jgi:hypothetical protein
MRFGHPFQQVQRLCAVTDGGAACFWVVLDVGTAKSQTQATHRVQAIIYAREAAIRTSTTNLAIYSIRVQRQTGAELEAIALDQYPHYDQELPTGLITPHLALSVRLSRTPYCDRVDDNHEGAVKTLPCFTIVHGSWKDSMRMPVEEVWWK